MRIKQSDLDGMIDSLNRAAETVPGVNEYLLDVAYGGYAINQRSGRGEKNISPRGTMREAYNYARAMSEGIGARKDSEEMALHERFFMVLDNDSGGFDSFSKLVHREGGYIERDEESIGDLLDKLFDSVEIRPDPSLPEELQEFRRLMVSQWISDCRHDLNPYAIYCHFKYRK